MTSVFAFAQKSLEKLYTLTILRLSKDKDYLIQSYACYSQGYYAEAIISLTQGIRMENEDLAKGLGYLRRGECYYCLGQYDKCLEDIAIAYKILVDEPLLLIRKSLCYLALGQYAEAIFSADKVLELDYDNKEALLCKAVIFIRLKNYLKAKTYFHRIFRIYPDYLEGYLERAKMLVEQNQYLQALQDIERCLFLEPDHPEATEQKGLIYQEIKAG